MIILGEQDWKARRRSHEERTSAWIDPHLARSAVGETHPVYDFLFRYYSHRPSHLRRWHPGIGVALEGLDADEFLASPHFERRGHLVTTITTLKPARREFVRWLVDLLMATRDRPPSFGCAGLHEWAMVYRTNDVRHQSHPLRLGSAGTDAVVESLPLRCTHYDAFRFFAEAARPLNRLQPTRPSAPSLEQSGCLHANMDLYKWAYKLAPFTPSELVAETFMLAHDIREIDMRASPYDLAALGFTPIPIEGPAGRAEYESHQRRFSERAAPLRDQLIAVASSLLEN